MQLDITISHVRKALKQTPNRVLISEKIHIHMKLYEWRIKKIWNKFFIENNQDELLHMTLYAVVSR